MFEPWTWKRSTITTGTTATDIDEKDPATPEEALNISRGGGTVSLECTGFYEFPITEGEAAAEGGEGKSSRRWAHRAGPDDY